MEFTPVGILSLLAAALIVIRPVRVGVLLLALFIPLQAAAAFNLWAVGGMSIVCAHFLIGALFIGLFLRPKLMKAMFKTSLAKISVILFGLFAAYAVLSALMMPRLFEGAVNVYSLERDIERGIALTPLHPTSGNITQSFYIVINFIFFMAAAFLISRPGGLRRITHAFNVMTGVHLLFAALSMAPSLAPSAVLLDFIRTANYSINAHHVVAGMPRLIGSYVEPSAFGAMSAGLFAWNFLRFLQTFGLWHLVASVLLLACVGLSFSTTAYAILVLLVVVWGLASLYKMTRRGLSPDHVRALFFGGVLALGLGFALFFFDPAQSFAAAIYEKLFGSKLDSASGLERGAWNLQGLRNFADTNGLGVGLGSARTSSLVTALLSNVGIIGAGLYLGFLNRSFLRAWPHEQIRSSSARDIKAHRIFSAARAAALALLLAHLIAGTAVDGGLMFILFAATATAAYSPSRKKKNYLIVGEAQEPRFAGFAKASALFGNAEGKELGYNEATANR